MCEMVSSLHKIIFSNLKLFLMFALIDPYWISGIGIIGYNWVRILVSIHVVFAGRELGTTQSDA